MKHLYKHIRIAVAFLHISWKNSIEYMNDFVVLFIDFIASIASTIIFWRFLLVDIDNLGNWSMGGLILIGIFGNASWAFGELLAGSWELSEKITAGRMDRYMCRPVNVLYSLVLEDMQVEELLKGVLSLAVLLVWYGFKFHVDFDLFSFLLAFFSMLIGVVIVAIVRCIYSCSAFWIENTDGFHYLIHPEDLNVDRYPLDIFDKAARIILLSIIPVGFVSYFPAMFYLHLLDYPLLFLLAEIVVMVLFATVLHFIWKKGIKKYEATGG